MTRNCEAWALQATIRPLIFVNVGVLPSPEPVAGRLPSKPTGMRWKLLGPKFGEGVHELAYLIAPTA
jgi:hypothetical protein